MMQSTECFQSEVNSVVPVRYMRQFKAREMECVKLLIDGFRSPEIAKILFRNYRTIQNRIHKMHIDYNVRTNAQLVAMAIKNKMVLI